MDNKTFENYQNRILYNLTKYVNTVPFTAVEFRQEIEKQFETVDSSYEIATHCKNTLLQCSNKTDALRTITDLYNMVKPISLQVGSWSSVASIVNECISEIQKSIYNPK